MEIGAGSLPTHNDCAPVIVPAFILITLNVAVLFAEIALVQIATPLPDDKLVIVICGSLLFRIEVLNDPVPGVLTVKDEVTPTAALAPERS
ncbi:MAG: hypothetical protein IPO63_14215 [Bacteroidetes bacterium]|nr:hypothetical protein [Bacteroidota bacterium]